MEQRRFSLVASLYENRDNRKGLPKALDEYLSFTDQPPSESELLDAARGFEDSKRKLREEWLKHGARNLNELIEKQEMARALNSPAQEESSASGKTEEPLTWDAQDFRHWLDTGRADPRTLALYFVKHEIQHYTQNIRFDWQPRKRADKFYRCLKYGSLLAAIWDLFSADTAGIPWRICPNHQKVFYPPRADRFYCTSTEQVAASKAHYDRYGRQRKRKRRKKPRR
jgi:hypothetical protein